MFFGRPASWRVATDSRVLPRCILCLLSAGLLAGCGEAGTRDISANLKPSETWIQAAGTAAPQRVQPTSHQETDGPPQLAAIMPALDYLPAVEDSQQPKTERQVLANHCWSFEIDGQDDTTTDITAHAPPALTRLPVVDQKARGVVDESTQRVVDETTRSIVDETTRSIVDEKMARDVNDETAWSDEFVPPLSAPGELWWHEPPIGNLLPPQVIFLDQTEVSESPLTVSPTELSEIPTEPLAPPAPKPTLPVLAVLTEQEQLLATLLQDSSSATTGVLTDRRINELAKTKIQQAYTMASRGAFYVAREELIEVLRMISQAKDAQRGTPERTAALAAGLRALREAEDFAPHGTQLEAELDIAVLCASHRTPLAKQPGYANLLPRLMMDRYLRYAQLQLAMSVAGEPAGSMALHALGKLASQLGRVEPSKHRLAERHAIAYQQAALLAHNQNHLAAHELGVLLATSGHLSEAEQLLKQVAAREPNAVVYRNLARVQDQLGQPARALASRDLAYQFNQQGATGTNDVQWVAPDDFVQVSSQAPHGMSVERPAAPRMASAQLASARLATEQPTTEQLVIPGSRPAARAQRR